MYLTNKSFHPVNFAFARGRRGSEFRIGDNAYRIEALGTADDIYRVRILNKRLWPRDYNANEMTPLEGARTECVGAQSRLRIDSRCQLTLVNNRGTPVLRSADGAGFGVCGHAWLFQFVREDDARYYGMGEKGTPFEKSGRTHKFWNTDAWADFDFDQVRAKEYDPDYVSVPYVIVKRGNAYVGVLIDNPFASVISVSAGVTISTRDDAPERTAPVVYLGAEDGGPSIYILYGPSLAELTRKLQTLTGRTPLPPLWALGYHQCRWGYRDRADLKSLADGFEKHGIPADGLWLDIDYMRGYRVFTFDKACFPNPRKDIAAIGARGYHVVPIIDPGVKHEAGYDVYEEGRARDVFCRNAAGQHFLGIVWPGFTVFPDFSLERCRAWWAEHVEAFARTGVAGAWLDMNDPSTGQVECVGMLFGDGKAPHEAYHNQYGMLMAKASREGFMRARPNTRPFLLARSGFTGAQRYTAYWTGDNFSNYHHLRRSIGKSINLALSGIPFNGPDIGGFGGDTTPELFVDWVKACCLFPFCRNHSCAGTRRQEPWALGPRALRAARTFVRLRYKLLPYLYNLFVEQEESGEAILRPLFYDFADSARLKLDAIDDQFMIGPSIMQAPFVVEGATKREVVLPPGQWYDTERGRWIAGSRRVTVVKDERSTPLFLRDGSLMPMQRGTRTDNRKDLTRIELLAALSPSFKGTARYVYTFDDGETFGYQRGKRSRYEVKASVRGKTISLQMTAHREGYGEPTLTPVTLAPFDTMVLDMDGERRALKPTRKQSAMFGRPVTVWVWR